MALHITDPLLDDLAGRAQQVLKAPSKTDAIRQALERVVEGGATDVVEEPEAQQTRRQLLDERLKALQARVKELGTPNPDFDEKAFLDEMWEI